MFIIIVRELGSDLMNFKLAWKMIALVTEKHFSDLTLLCVNNQAPVLQCYFCSVRKV